MEFDDAQQQVRDLIQRLGSSEQRQQRQQSAIRALEGENGELRRAVCLVQSGLADAFEGWGAMHQCASRHGWNGQLQLIDFEACGSDGLPDWNSSHMDSLEELCEASVEELCAKSYRNTQ